MSSYHKAFSASVSTLRENAEEFSLNVVKNGEAQRTRNVHYDQQNSASLSSILGGIAALKADATTS